MNKIRLLFVRLLIVSFLALGSPVNAQPKHPLDALTKAEIVLAVSEIKASSEFPKLVPAGFFDRNPALDVPR